MGSVTPPPRGPALSYGPAFSRTLDPPPPTLKNWIKNIDWILHSDIADISARNLVPRPLTQQNISRLYACVIEPSTYQRGLRSPCYRTHQTTQSHFNRNAHVHHNIDSRGQGHYRHASHWSRNLTIPITCESSAETITIPIPFKSSVETITIPIALKSSVETITMPTPCESYTLERRLGRLLIILGH